MFLNIVKGYIVTIAYGFMIAVTSLFPKACSKWMEGWGKRSVKWIFRPLGMEIKTEGRATSLVEYDGPIVTLVNHPFTIVFYAMASNLFRMVGYRRFVPVIKQWPWYLRWTILLPFSGALKLAGAIVIPRNGNAIDVIRKKMHRFRNDQVPPVYMIFSDGHRPFRDRIEKAKEFLREFGCPDELVDSLKYCQAPRPSGIAAIMEALQDQNSCLVSWTVGLSRWPQGPKNPGAADLQGTTVHLHWVEVPKEDWPNWSDRKAVQNWLINEQMWEVHDRLRSWIEKEI